MPRFWDGGYRTRAAGATDAMHVKIVVSRFPESGGPTGPSPHENTFGEGL
jgi:hypothetical protein